VKWFARDAFNSLVSNDLPMEVLGGTDSSVPQAIWRLPPPFDLNPHGNEPTF